MAARVEVRAPLGETEGARSQVQRWLKAPGDFVGANEPLLELETDKVTVEIAAPVGGTLHEIVKPAETDVAPGDLLAIIVPAAEGGVAAAQPGPVSAPAAAGHAPGPRASSRDPGGATPSPAVQRLLAERGLTAAQVRGSGRDGRITIDDVLAAAAPRDAQAGMAPPAPVVARPAPAGEAAPEAGTRREPHSAMRRRIAERMVESLREAPHVTTMFEVDLGAVLAHRARHQAQFAQEGIPLTLTAYFLAACVAAIRAVPEVNSRWTEDALELHEAMHIGVATALGERGLVVPVVRDVQALDLRGIARALRDLVARAREDALTPADVRGGTFTISNHGVSGSLVAAPIIINQPQSAILGVGRLEKRAVVVTEDGVDRVVVRPRCYVTLTIDHRVMDGQRANHFLGVLVRELEQVSN
ncbi:MAG: dihydrolipoamide acetyltransferase family protein [Steroidobacteraceae bacterium]